MPLHREVARLAVERHGDRHGAPDAQVLAVGAGLADIDADRVVQVVECPLRELEVEQLAGARRVDDAEGRVLAVDLADAELDAGRGLDLRAAG